MAHLSKFGVGNFRVFQELEELKLAPITVFTGTNNSGKSSFIKGLLLVRDNIINDSHNNNSFFDMEKLDFTIGEHKTGDFARSKNISSNKKEISFTLPFFFDEIADEMTLKLNYVLDNSNQLKNGKLTLIKVVSERGALLIEIKPAMDNRWDVWFDMVYFRMQLHKLLEKEVISNEQEKELKRKQKEFLEKNDWDEGKLLKNTEYLEILDLLDEAFHQERIYMASEKIYFAKKHPTNSVRFSVNKDEKLKNRPFKCIEDQLSLFWKTWFLSESFRKLFFQTLPDDYYSDFWKNSEFFQSKNNANNRNKKEFDKWFERQYLGYLNDIVAQLFESGFNIKGNEYLLRELIENELEVISNRVLRKVNFIMTDYEVEEYFQGVENCMNYYFSGIKSDISNEDFYDTPEKFCKKSLIYNYLSLYNSLLKNKAEFKEISDFFERTLSANYFRNDESRRLSTHFTNIFFNEFLNKGFKKSYYESLKVMSKVEFIEAVRANSQRLYSFSTQGTGFNQLLREYSSIGLGESGKEINFIRKWTKKFGLGEEVQIKPFGDGIGTYVSVDNIPLADCGYGITQLVPILLKVAIVAYKNFNRESMDYNSGYMWRYNPSVLLVEEPETNLHPELQSKLADMFVDAAGTFNIQFILETHSEYLIRKLQYLTANKDHEFNIKPEDTAIFYFNNPKNLQKDDQLVRRISIRENGILDGSFGPGFFDEASNLIKEIFKLSGAN